ncbi:PrsW family intramembrane metalloprotease [Nocardioides rotundus]|uniref:PrsW family intramembrane metalloprotease n=1 Tax=Nocardioides rotundus TaxID=1774216 RepID=UPI001CC185AF|nr:PrsW family intramembrane metalloprotease [Nocardioides rotundus]UAL29025.1 PrsW family intramembrane metalloprotease [Nocardioides rotundus]
MPRSPRNSVAFTVVVTLVALLGGGLMFTVIAASGAPDILLVATVLAVLPVGPLVACFLWLDRYEPEPRSLLVAGLLWGALASTGTALVLQGVGSLRMGWTEFQSLAIGAPVTEELTKGIFLLLLLWWRRDELDGILDGIVYAGMVGIGFAFTENILYLAAAYQGGPGMGPGGVDALTQVFVLRGLFSPFAHPLFTVFTGIGIGIAVGSRSPVVRVLAPLLGYALAVLTHGLWNASSVYDGGRGFLGVYVAIMFPAFLLLTGFAIWSRRTEKRILTASLTDAARRGLLPASDIPWLVDLGSRRRMRRFVKEQGPEALQALRAYQQAAIELGFLHHRFLRGTAPRDFSSRGQVHVARIQAARPYFSFPGQVVPTR